MALAHTAVAETSFIAFCTIQQAICIIMSTYAHYDTRMSYWVPALPHPIAGHPIAQNVKKLT